MSFGGPAAEPPPWRETPEGLVLAVRLTPRGGRDAVEGVGADADGAPHLKVRVSAPPVDGAANDALLKLIAKACGVRRGDVSFVSGETARLKRLLIAGDAAAIAAALDGALSRKRGT